MLFQTPLVSFLLFPELLKTKSLSIYREPLEPVTAPAHTGHRPQSCLKWGATEQQSSPAVIPETQFRIWVHDGPVS